MVEHSNPSPHSSSDLTSGQSSATRSVLVGRLFVVIAAVMWSTGGVFAKAPIFDAWPQEIRGSLLAFWRAAFASLILVFLVRRVQWSWKLLPTTLIFALMNLTYLSSLVHCEATLAIWLQYTAPIWVFLFGMFFLGERPAAREWMLLAFASAGLAIIIWAEADGATPIGFRYGILSGIFYAGVVLTIRWCREFDPAWLIFLNQVVTCLVFAPVLLRNNIYPAGPQWLYLLAFGALQMGIPYFFFSRALKSVSSHDASGITLLEPLLLPVWVFVVWRHSPDYIAPAWTTVLGGSLILAGLVIRYLGRRKVNAS